MSQKFEKALEIAKALVKYPSLEYFANNFDFMKSVMQKKPIELVLAQTLKVQLKREILEAMTSPSLQSKRLMSSIILMDTSSLSEEKLLTQLNTIQIMW